MIKTNHHVEAQWALKVGLGKEFMPPAGFRKMENHVSVCLIFKTSMKNPTISSTITSLYLCRVLNLAKGNNYKVLGMNVIPKL